MGLSPLLLWIAFNSWRLDRITVAPAGGLPQFHLGFLLGDPTPEKTDNPLFLKFTERFKEVRAAATEEDIIGSNNILDGRLPLYSHNIDAAFSVAKELSLSWISFYDFMERYAQLSKAQNRSRYFIHLRAGVSQLLDTLPLLIFTLYLLYRYGARAPVLGAVCMIVLHILVSISLILITPMNVRYYSLTIIPALLSVIFGVAATYCPVRTNSKEPPSLLGH